MGAGWDDTQVFFNYDIYKCLQLVFINILIEDGTISEEKLLRSCVN